MDTKITGSFKYHLDGTIKKGTTRTDSSGIEVGSSCKTTIEAGTRVEAKANYLVGEVIGNFVADVTTTWTCPDGISKPSHTETVNGNVSISNVPSESSVGSCTIVQEPCKSKPSLPFEISV